MAKKKKRSLLLIFLGYSCVYLDKTIIGMSIIPMAHDLGIDASQKGLILSTFFLGYTLFQIPFGYLGNKLGSRKILIFSILLIGILMLLLGFGFSLLYVLVIRFCAGSFAHAGYPSAVSGFITKEITVEERGPVQSAMISSGGFASIVGPLVAAPFLMLLGWKMMYLTYGVVVILIGLLMIKGIPTRYGQKMTSTSGRKTIQIVDVLKDKNVWALLLSAFFMNAAIYGLTGWQASYLVDTFKLTLGQISGLTAAVGVVMMITALGSGVFVKRFFTGREKIFIVVTGVLGALCVFTTSMTDSLALAGLFLALSVGCASCAFSTLMSMPVKLFVPAEVSTKYSIINTAGVAGGFVAPIVIGKLVDSGQGSYTNAFIFIAVTLGLSGLIAAVVTAKKKIEVDYV
ncbi:MFS transporter [Enterococcus sp. CSURQ0835]|uniref:MFS transporter n=1 Tax=Enterococcus sp. CSURQ0835 TaxID=2681394 RepID=UPI001F2D9D4C|nr:MFS transporter [Enterococcus sp. CSURQ0835]